MNARRLATVLGVGALALGLVGVLAPGTVALGLDRVLVSVVGVLALVGAWRVLRQYRRGAVDEATTPDPELPVATPPLGDDFDAVVSQFVDTRRDASSRDRVRDGLRSAATAVLTQYGTDGEAEAVATLDAGTWTDDRTAAAFLAGDDASALPLRTRVRDRLRRESARRRSIRHAVDAIAAAAGVTLDSDGGPPDPVEASRRDADASAGRTTVDGDGVDALDDIGELDAETGGVVSRAVHPTGRWRGVTVVALVGVGVGILAGEPAALLAGCVGVGFAAYARARPFPPGEVVVDRTLDDPRPDAGDEVDVTVTVTNETGRFLPDLRLVDGVPEALAVTDGSPRLGTALRPGERTTVTYTVTARRGVHSFDPTLLVARDLPGTVEGEWLLASETTLTCLPALRPLSEPVPLREQATQYVGRVETPNGGSGLEFHATREYRPGDAPNRIDWNRRARTGELTTVEYREERAATVVLVVDARRVAYVSPDPETPHAVDRSVDAAGRLYATLTGAGDRVGITALSSLPCWLAPGSGTDHRLRARELLSTHDALSPVPRWSLTATPQWRDRLRKRLSGGTQVLFLTPLPDAFGVQFARHLDESGFPVTILSPDPTAGRTPGHRLARVARTLRVSTLRGTGIPVVDWGRDESLDVALARHEERWSR